MIWELDFIRNIQQSLGQSDFLAHIMRVLTFAGDAGLIWLILSLVFIANKKNRLMGLAVFVCWAVATVQNEYFIKIIVGRTRPFTQVGYEDIRTYAERWLGTHEANKMPLGIFGIPGDTSNSYFSGHTTMSFACATPIFFFHRKVGWLSYLLAGFIAFSRIFFGVHYPTDIIGGIILGVGIGIIVSFLTRYILDKIRIRNRLHVESEVLIY